MADPLGNSESTDDLEDSVGRDRELEIGHCSVW